MELTVTELIFAIHFVSFCSYYFDNCMTTEGLDKILRYLFTNTYLHVSMSVTELTL